MRKRKKKRVEIVAVAKTDAYWSIRHLLVGVRGWSENDLWPNSVWCSGKFIPYRMTKELREEIGSESILFYKCKLKEL